MSEYWDKMLIAKNNLSSTDNQELIISQENPNFFAPKGFYNIYYINIYVDIKNKEKLIKEVSQFYCKNNVLTNGNMTLVKVADLQRYINIGSELIFLRNKLTKEIIGSILSATLPIRINVEGLNIDDLVQKTERYNCLIDPSSNSVSNNSSNYSSNNSDSKTLVFGVTTFLNNGKNYRGKGLGMVLIQESLQVAYSLGITCAYFLNTVPRCSNAVPVRCWIYPLNINKLDRYKLSYNKNYTSKYLNLDKEGAEILSIQQNLLKESHKIYLNLIKDKKFSFAPNLYLWGKWCENFPTYMITFDKKNVGIFSFIHYTIYVPDCGKEVEYGNRLICIGEENFEYHTVKCMIYQAQKNGIDILLLQEIGDLTNSLLSKIYAQRTRAVDYLNFYNARIQLEPKDIYSPLI